MFADRFHIDRVNFRSIRDLVAYLNRIVLILALQGMSVSHAAESPADSTDAFSLRHYLYLVSPSTLRPYLEALTNNFLSRHPQPAPIIETQPATVAAKHFCAGSGGEYPDAVILPRRISHSEYRRCKQQIEGGIAELSLGQEVLILAVTRDVPIFSLSVRQLYLALAAQVPKKGAFSPNAYHSWKDIDPRLPDMPIQIALPVRGQLGRDVLDNRVLQAGCRGIAEVRAIYSAAQRLTHCLQLRDDGRVVELPANELSRYLKQPTPGAIAMLPPQLYEAAGRQLAALPCEGVLPTRTSIQSDDYPLSRPLYLYAKLGHIVNSKGYGVTAGLDEFLQDLSGEEVTEPGGDLDRLGLALLPKEQRIHQRLDVLLLRPMNR
jgi:phosphate transport system substrate-binding protein